MRSLAEPDHPADITVQVTGHQWWWEISYPNDGVVTANEIHIPVGKAVEIELTSDDVIHSFWVPNLTSKRDLIPGQTNTLWFQADSAGIYRGECAEFCGTEHALMAFLVIAQPLDEYGAWLHNQQASSVQPADSLIEQGQQAFLGSACVYCHTINGTAASGKVGPDLTHLASRQTLAAGTLDNTTGNLAGWILNPQALKPGNHMPATRLDSDDLQALLAYLESLK
jgi:cytochrome c oxidase subunit 2